LIGVVDYPRFIEENLETTGITDKRKSRFFIAIEDECGNTHND
jgi:hypothetical protein